MAGVPAESGVPHYGLENGDPGWVPAAALRRCLRDGYGREQFRGDVVAGIVVGVVALPLSMALAVAAGVAPHHGLYTAIVAGAVVALLGGSRVQVTGPTAAFVVLLAPIAARFGVGGLLLATMLAGLVLVLFGLARLGRLIEFVPYPVTAGFTAGIAVVIGILQLKDLLGLEPSRWPAHFLERVVALAAALPGARWDDAAVGAAALCCLVVWPARRTRVPAPVAALVLCSLLAAALHAVEPGFSPATIGTRFSYEAGGVLHPGVPRTPPLPLLPWHAPGPDGAPIGLSVELMRELAPSALAIAMLGAIESLLSAVIADGMIRRKHDPNAELVAQGVGNVLAPFFGGIAATGAIARTATNIRAGGRSPVAAVIHSAVVLVSMVALAPLLAWLPMAALAAVLLVVAWNMGEFGHVVRMIRTSPRSDSFVLLVCFGLTVGLDMVVAVTAGVVLAALLFMRRMADVTDIALVAEPHRTLAVALPDHVVLYEVMGPLFFGAAQKAMSALHTVAPGVRTVVLDLRNVPTIDATGLVNLQSAVRRLRESGVTTVLAGVRPEPLATIRRAGWADDGPIAVERFDEGLRLALER